MLKFRLNAVVSVLALFVLLFHSCSAEDNPQPKYPQGDTEAGELENVDWALESYGEPGE